MSTVYIHTRVSIHVWESAHARQIAAGTAPPNDCVCRMVGNQARRETGAAQTHVLPETAVDAVVIPAFWRKPLWKPL